MTKPIVRNGGKPCEDPIPSRTETFFMRGIDRIKQAIAVPVSEPTEEQRLIWAEQLRLQAIRNKQAEQAQFVINNEVYEQAVQDTPDDIKALNADFNAQVEALNPSDGTPAPVLKPVSQKSDEPGTIEYTKNRQENLVLNHTAAELLQARRDSIREHSKRQRAKQMEAASKENEKPKSRREKR